MSNRTDTCALPVGEVWDLGAPGKPSPARRCGRTIRIIRYLGILALVVFNSYPLEF